MKKLVLFVVLAGVFVASNVFACGGGLHGLEINGGSAVGGEHYLGVSHSHSAGVNCLSVTRTHTRQIFKGVSVSSHANGKICLGTIGNQGSVAGKGVFRSKVSGNFQGGRYKTSSLVVVKGSNQ